MKTNTFVIRKVTRYPKSTDDDELCFETGVNVISGSPNTGKTRWLQMIDFLFGDRSTPEDAFGVELASKYSSIEATIQIGTETILFERKWNEPNLKTKVLIDGVPYTVDDFSNELLEKLGIPILHYPKGSPYVERAWPVLSWRSLYRHIYRQQRFWSDISDKQPEGERLAAVMQFFGVAEKVFSEEYSNLVKMSKEISRLQGAKDQYLKILDSISQEILTEFQGVAVLTEDSIEKAIARLSEEIEKEEESQQQSYENLWLKADVDQLQVDKGDKDYREFAEDYADLQAYKENNLSTVAKIDNRLTQIIDYKSLIEEELLKLERSRHLDSFLTNAKVTECPACDQDLHSTASTTTHCFLCKQATQQIDSQANGKQLFEAEISRLREEKKEAAELISILKVNLETRKHEQQTIEMKLSNLENNLNSIRKVASAIIPPEINISNMEIGRLQERIRQLGRIKQLLENRKKLSTEIDLLSDRLKDLEAAVILNSQKTNYEQINDDFSDSMEVYLSSLKAGDKQLWAQERVKFRLAEKSLKVLVGSDDWSIKLGATFSLYLLLSYHYALLNLTGKNGCHYPGLAIIDLPPQLELEDDFIIKDYENYIVQPFIDLLAQPEYNDIQVIMTGAAFEGLEGANKIQFNTVY